MWRSTFFNHNFLFSLIIALTPVLAYSQAIPESFTYQGRLFDGESAPLSGTYNLTVQIYSPVETCLLFEEAHAITTEDGTFSINVGQGMRTSSDPAALPLTQIFNNQLRQLVPNSATCLLGSGYLPSPSDKRKIKVIVSGEGYSAELDAQVINSVPQALVAQTLQGLTPTELLRVWPDTASRPASPPSNTYGVNIATGDMEQWDGSTWNLISLGGGGGDITSVNVNPPLVGGGGTGDVGITLPAASGATDGYLTSANWNLFNSKQNRVTGTCAAGNSIREINADGSVICEPDNLGAANLFATINPTAGTAPVADATADILNVTGTSGVTVTGDETTDTLTFAIDETYAQRRVSSSCGAGSAISAIAANGTVTCEPDNDSGGDVTAVNTTAPLAGGGGSGDLTLSIPQANGTTDGFLDSADWTTFNSKQGSIAGLSSIEINSSGTGNRDAFIDFH
jgi:hypothetical protein